MTDNTPQTPSIMRGGQLDRRKFLWSAAAGLAVVAGGASLVACAGGSQGGGQTAAGPTGAAQPRAELRLGAQGGASTDTLDAQNGLTNADFNRIYQLYDQLVA